MVQLLQKRRGELENIDGLVNEEVVVDVAEQLQPAVVGTTIHGVLVNVECGNRSVITMDQDHT